MSIRTKKAIFAASCLLLLALDSSRAQESHTAAQQWSMGHDIPFRPEPRNDPVQTNPAELLNHPARLIYAVRPQYPPQYAEKGVQGSVLVDFIVDANGSVIQAEAVTSPDPRLAQAAEAAVMQWIFSPAYRDGAPIASHMRIPIVFAGAPERGTEDLEAAASQARARGEKAMDAHNYKDAFSAFNEALLLTPDIAELVFDRAMARWGEKEVNSALADFAEASRLNPDEYRYHASWAGLCFDQKNYAGAIAQFDTAIRLAPDVAFLYSHRGEAYAGAGRDDEALDDFEQALVLDGKDDSALAGRKLILDKRASWSPQQREWVETRYRTFQTVWRTVDETYYDPTFGGVNWQAVREKYRAGLAGIPDNAKLRYLLYAMLAELKRTHFAILPREGAVFNPSERIRIGTAGVDVALLNGQVVVEEVRKGSPGAAAGLKPGDTVTRVDAVIIDRAMEALAKAQLPAAKRGLYLTEFVQSRLEGAVGSKVRLGLLGADGAARDAIVTCGPNDGVWSEPAGHFPSVPVRCTAVRGGDGIAYLRFNAFALPVMKKVRPFLRSLQPGDGLIIDLRGNEGGITIMALGISGLVSDREFSFGTMHSREGQTDLIVYPQTGAFAGPVAILIDSRSASTSEILAAGLQEAGRAKVFGERSAGAALPSVFTSLPTGDLFQYAVADLVTSQSAVLEGEGVKPDQVVLPTRADLAAGRDPVLDAARMWITQINGKADGK